MSIVIALVLTGCAPVRLRPAEKTAWQIEEEEGPWLPCVRRFRVTSAGSPHFLRDNQAACDAGQPEACSRLAFVDLEGCRGHKDPARAAQLRARACQFGEAAACTARSKAGDTR